MMKKNSRPSMRSELDNNAMPPKRIIPAPEVDTSMFFLQPPSAREYVSIELSHSNAFHDKRRERVFIMAVDAALSAAR